MAKKRKILFVDDEPNILQGLKRMLRSMRHEWEMDFVESGKNALELMTQHPFDVVVSDMRMPGMSGADLLENVMNKYPQTVRIVLSGHSDRDMILRSVRTAHQYLSKPCDAEMLISTVSRACSLREIMLNDEMKRLVSKMDSLPSLPTLYMEIMNELQSPESSMKNVGGIIEKDIGMSAKILQLVNSAFFGLPRHVASPGQAVSLLGMEVVKSLALAVQVFSQFDQSRLKNLSLDALWHHSEAVGHFSKKIYESESKDTNYIGYALIAGFLHDIGKLIFMSNFPEKYDSMIAESREKEIPLSSVELDSFGVTHGEVGAYLLSLWGLPDLVVEAIAHHHSPSRIPVKVLSPLAVVHAANIIEHELSTKENCDIAHPVDIAYFDEAGLADRLSAWKEICLKSIQTGD
ncbi:HDOD domain-containing protein [bacterium]|nr:HDOD domain-containing protein [bacterium]